MPSFDILNSHTITNLKKEVSKTNIKGYSKMKKNEVIDLMLKNKSKFHHIKKYGEPVKKIVIKREVKPIKKVVIKREPKEVKPIKKVVIKREVKPIKKIVIKREVKPIKKVVIKREPKEVKPIKKVVIKKKAEPKKEEPKKKEEEIKKILKPILDILLDKIKTINDFKNIKEEGQKEINKIDKSLIFNVEYRKKKTGIRPLLSVEVENKKKDFYQSRSIEKDLKEEPKKEEPKQQGGAKAKTQAQIKREEKAEQENKKDIFLKTGGLPKNELSNFFNFLDKITKSNSRRRDKQFSDNYGDTFLKDIFGQQGSGDFYSTPKHCLEDLDQERLKINFTGNHILEVSAGLGSMLNYFMDFNKDVKPQPKFTAIELNKRFSDFLKSSFPKVNVLQGDFFKVSKSMYKWGSNGFERGSNDFDAILANPPFTAIGKPKFYLDFLWRSIAIMKSSSKTYEKEILFISPPLDDIKKIGDTLDPYKLFNSQSKKAKEDLYEMYLGTKKPNKGKKEYFLEEILPLQIELIGTCEGFGGTKITAYIYGILTY